MRCCAELKAGEVEFLRSKHVWNSCIVARSLLVSTIGDKEIVHAIRRKCLQVSGTVTRLYWSVHLLLLLVCRPCTYKDGSAVACSPDCASLIARKLVLGSERVLAALRRRGGRAESDGT